MARRQGTRPQVKSVCTRPGLKKKTGIRPASSFASEGVVQRHGVPRSLQCRALGPRASDLRPQSGRSGRTPRRWAARPARCWKRPEAATVSTQPRCCWLPVPDTTSHGTTLVIPVLKVKPSLGRRVAAHLPFAKCATRALRGVRRSREMCLSPSESTTAATRWPPRPCRRHFARSWERRRGNGGRPSDYDGAPTASELSGIARTHAVDDGLAPLFEAEQRVHPRVHETTNAEAGQPAFGCQQA